jgi:subtilase family serine protease
MKPSTVLSRHIVPTFEAASRYGKAGLLAILGTCSWMALTSTSAALERAVVGAPAAADRTVDFDIYLPLRDREGLETLLDALHTPGSAQYRHWLTPAQFDARFGPSKSTVDAITRELAAFGLRVTQAHTHSLHVSGPVSAVDAAFATKLAAGRFASSGKEVLVATAPLRLSDNLAAAGALIAHFSGTIHMRNLGAPRADLVPQNRESPAGGYWFDDLKQAYSYPSFHVLTGASVHIGVLMTPNFNPPDMDLYFGHEKVLTPNITTFNVEGGAPFNAGEAAETQIDIQHSGGMALDASIVLYNIPDLADDSILAALTEIVELNESDVVNMSFGGPEAGYTPAYNGGVDMTGILGIYDDFFAEGNALGITWVAASGDWGALDIPAPACFNATPPTPCGPMEVGVGIPAASPHVTAVGGTNLVTTYDASNPDDLNSTYVRENAFDDPLIEDIFYGTTATGAVWGSGGGISMYFAKPRYQKDVSQQFLPREAKRWRTIPDVALEMGGCPGGTVYFQQFGTCAPDRSFDWVALGGVFAGYIGTSLSSPDFVGLTALKIQYEGGRLGNENYEIYALAAAQEDGSGPRIFRQNIRGNNGVYTTARGYNLVIGNGTVVGNNFVHSHLSPAGVPQTPSNP